MPRFPYNISYSGLSAFLDCPRRYFYDHHPGIPKRIDYERLCGKLIHTFIQRLYKPPGKSKQSKEKFFYYRDKDTMRKAWTFEWLRALRMQKDALIGTNTEKAGKFLGVGVKCLYQYWDDNFERDRPMAVEKRLTYPIRPGITMVGIIDQIRQVDLYWIASHRPDLVVDGRLNDAYDPILLLDLKSHYHDYTPHRLAENPTEEQWVRTQFELHEYMQPSVYTYLYQKIFNKKPIGFAWYHLRSGKMFFTYREDRDIASMFHNVEHFVSNVSALSFPKRVDNHCARCDHLIPCREDREFYISQPESLPFSDDFEMKLVPNVVSKESQQMRLAIKIPRRKLEKPLIPEQKTAKEIVISDVPWDQPALFK